MTRRHFVWSVFIFSAFNIFHHRQIGAYQVRFLVDLKEHDEAEFFRLQSRYEDNEAIDRLSLEYERRGWILGQRLFEKSNDHLVWTYKFKDKEAFQKWESALYRSGIVQKNGRPYVIKRQESYVLV